MQIGFIGLGRMGKNMVLHQLEQGNQVIAWNRSTEPREELKEESKKLKKGSENLTIVDSLDGLVSSLRESANHNSDTVHLPGEVSDVTASSHLGGGHNGIIIWLMVTAGEAVDAVLETLAEKLKPGDLVIDGGNSFYKDTLIRNEFLAKMGIHFMDVGTSGGIEGARHGACLMIGGSKEDYERALEIFKAAAAPNGFGLLGPVGAGHFAKTIHNGIEYGMMEAIGEGAAILKAGPFKFDLREVFRVYSVKSIIDSRLVSWALNELNKDPNLADISSVIGSGGGSGKTKGEGHWTLDLAKEMGVDTPVIEASVKVRDNSDRDEENSPNGFRNKVVAAMRFQFGQHPVKKSKS